jgi:endonuclease III
MKAEHVWSIPWEVKELLGHLDPIRIEKMSLQEIESVLSRIRHRPRYYKDAPKTIADLTHIVVRRFGGDAAAIWRGRRSSEVHDLFLSIYGVGEGIASMAVVLIEKARLREPFPPEDRKTMDIKPDVHLRRVLCRIGVARDQTVNEALRASRWLNPSCPADLNEPLWDIGRMTCHASAPECHLCPIDGYCARVGV